MSKPDKPKECRHPGYVIRDGILVCDACGQPSPSPKWQSNVYGAQAQSSAKGARQ